MTPTPRPRPAVRVFEGQGRTRRVASFGVGTVLFGGIAAYLWLEVAPTGGPVLPLVVSAAALAIGVAFVAAVRNLSAPLVRVTLGPRRFRQGDEVELRWEAPEDARVERLRLAVLEVRVTDSGDDRVRQPVTRHELVDVRGGEACAGSRNVLFPRVSGAERGGEDRREFDLVVETETALGDGGLDTYELGRCRS